MRPEWAGHTWASLEASMTPTLVGAGPAGVVAGAAAWADEPANALYVRSASLRRAYGVAVAVAQRAAHSIAVDRGSSRHLIAVGVLDELSVPTDPDPESTAENQANPRKQDWTAADTRRRFLDAYAKPLERADLTLLRLPAGGDAERVLDQIADRRRNYLKPTILAGTVLPQEFASAYGDTIATRFGFPRADGTISAPAQVTVLELDQRA